MWNPQETGISKLFLEISLLQLYPINSMLILNSAVT